MSTASVVEYFGFHRQVLFLCHTGRSRVIQFLQLRDGILDVTQQHVCRVVTACPAGHTEYIWQLLHIPVSNTR